jgi:hypothetical protein
MRAVRTRSAMRRDEGDSEGFLESSMGYVLGSSLQPLGVSSGRFRLEICSTRSKSEADIIIPVAPTTAAIVQGNKIPSVRLGTVGASTILCSLLIADTFWWGKQSMNKNNLAFPHGDGEVFLPMNAACTLPILFIVLTILR